MSLSDDDKGKRRVPYTANKLATIAKYFIKHHVTPLLKECRKILERFHITRDEKQLQDRVKNFISKHDILPAIVHIILGI